MQKAMSLFVSGDGSSVLGWIILALVMFGIVCKLVRQGKSNRQRIIGQVIPYSADRIERAARGEYWI